MITQQKSWFNGKTDLVTCSPKASFHLPFLPGFFLGTRRPDRPGAGGGPAGGGGASVFIKLFQAASVAWRSGCLPSWLKIHRICHGDLRVSSLIRPYFWYSGGGIGRVPLDSHEYDQPLGGFGDSFFEVE